MKTPTKKQLAKMSAVLFGRQGGLIGGLATSEAKTNAARINGAKGGRPRKVSIIAGRKFNAAMRAARRGSK